MKRVPGDTLVVHSGVTGDMTIGEAIDMADDIRRRLRDEGGGVESELVDFVDSVAAAAAAATAEGFAVEGMSGSPNAHLASSRSSSIEIWLARFPPAPSIDVVADAARLRALPAASRCVARCFWSSCCCGSSQL